MGDTTVWLGGKVDKKSALTLRLLGGCEVSGPAGPVRLESNKTSALLAYLAVEGGSHSRPKLAGLLWGDLPEANASRNLRRALWDLKRKLSPSGDELIEATRSEVSFHGKGRCWTDVDALRAACGHLGEKGPVPPEEAEMEGLQRAVLEGRGSLLDGLFLEGAPGFEEWIYAERERLRSMAVGALGRLAQIQEERGNLRESLECARHLVALDPWLEEGHRTLMRLLALGGEPAAALRQYETLRRILSEELGAAPTAETAALCEAIRSGELAPAGTGAGRSRPHSPPRNLPLQPTPFVGRARELASLRSLLADPACRLLTLLGAGGIGKTRLAVEAASGLGGPPEDPESALFPDGIFFVSLNELDASSRLPSALREALGLRAGAAEEPSGQLSNYLSGRRLLLILDAFEQVLDGAPWIAEVLRMGPGVRVLATSRERLDLQGEWVFEVGGMELAEDGGGGGGSLGDAVELFLQGARRVNLGFSPEGTDLTHVLEICRRVGGMPLGIELAAACARHLTPAEIAEEIGASLDFLASASRDVPERQRSLRAVFDHAWGRLPPEERRAFASLSAFHGGFGREAAKAVADAPAEILAALTDKSLLSRAPSGRYRIHEVLRQYGEERLRESPPDWESARSRHRHFFLGWLSRPCNGEPGAAPPPEEIDNVRAAWSCAAESGDTDLLLASLDRYTRFHDTLGLPGEGLRSLDEAEPVAPPGKCAPGPEQEMWIGALRSSRGLFQTRMGHYEGAAASLEEAVARLREARAPFALAQALCRLGEARLWLGEYAPAERSLLESIPLAGAAKGQALAAEALGHLGRISRERGDHGEAHGLLEESLALSRRAGDEALQTRLLNQFAYLESYLGNMEASRRLREEALHLARKLRDKASEALALSGLAVVAFFGGRFADARGHLEESLALCEEIGDRNGVARALANLAENGREQGRYEEALSLNRDSMALHEAAGNRMALAAGLGNAGLSEIALGRLDRARDHLREGLRLALELGALPAVTALLTASARLLVAEGRPYEALEILGAALAHPAVTVDARRDAAPLIDALRADLPARRVEAALKRGRTCPIEEMARRLGG